MLRLDHRLSPTRPTALVALLLVLAGPSPDQVQVVDEGILRVTQGRREVAREEFTVALTSANRMAGYRVSATAFYPPRRTRVSISPVLDLGTDSLPRFVQFASSRRAGERVQARIGPRRLTIQRVSLEGESWVELPGHPRTMVVDDSSFALYAMPPGFAEGTVSVVTVRRETRSEFELRVLGLEETTVDGRSRTLRHVTLTAGADVRHLWYDDRGRLFKVELPNRGLTAERVDTT